MKTCPDCGVAREATLENFYKARNNSFVKRCKDCHNAKRMQSYTAHPRKNGWESMSEEERQAIRDELTTRSMRSVAMERGICYIKFCRWMKLERQTAPQQDATQETDE